ncbi:MAG: DUF4142 domain-containing protein [Gemmatimonadales bacterium]
MTGAAVPLTGPGHTAVVRIGDAEILGTIGSFDANEGEAAKLGTTKAQAADVKSYARLLLADHQRSQANILRLSKQLHMQPILPADSSITRAHKAEMDQLNLMSAAEFDKAFMQNMVADHKMMLGKIDSVLRPAATRVQVKRILRTLRPVIAAHLARGQAWLNKQKP